MEGQEAPLTLSDSRLPCGLLPMARDPHPTLTLAPPSLQDS